MHVNCPSCGEHFPIVAGFAEADGKRLAALLAEMEPVLGRAVLGYLRLFKPARQALRTARAVKLVAELDALVRAGSVCRDERGGVRRPATPAMWAEGIEQMLAKQAQLTLPLANHHYLRAIVYGIADGADAAAERQREADARAGRRRDGASASSDAGVGNRRKALLEALSVIQGDLALGLIDEAEAEQRRTAARAKHGGQAA